MDTESKQIFTPAVITSFQFNFFRIFHKLHSEENEVMEFKGNWLDNIKMDLKKIGCEDVGWIHVVHDRTTCNSLRISILTRDIQWAWTYTACNLCLIYLATLFQMQWLYSIIWGNDSLMMYLIQYGHGHAFFHGKRDWEKPRKEWAASLLVSQIWNKTANATLHYLNFEL